MHKYAHVDRASRCITLLLFALQLLVFPSVYAADRIALNVPASVTIADSSNNTEEGSSGASGVGIDPDTSAQAIAGKEIVFHYPETIYPSQYVRFTAVIPEPQLATKVILRAFGHTYTLVQKTRNAYVASLFAPDSLGTYPYTVTAYYGGSTSLSTRGVITITTRHLFPVEQPISAPAIRQKLTLEEPIISTPIGEEILPTQSPAPGVLDHYETVTIHVIDDQGNNLVGARVTLASKPQTDTTDEHGNVSFKNIPIGQHTITVAYKGAMANQSLFLDQQTKSVEVLLVAKLEGGRYAQWQLVLVGAVCIIGTLGFVALVGIYKRRYNR